MKSLQLGCAAFDRLGAPLLVAIGLLALACGTDEGSPSGSTGTGDSGASESASTTGAGGDTGGAGGGAPTLPTCQIKCASAFDCASPTPATDEDNWDCVDTQCVYLGCLTSQECMETFQSGNYTCAKLTDASVATCNPTCATPTDCATDSPLTDPDNWTCVDKACVYLGCQSSLECMETFQNGNYACEKLSGASLPTCNLSCTTPTDCATDSPLTDPDNWTCVDEECVYLGCKSDQECMETYQNGNYFCVAP